MTCVEGGFVAGHTFAARIGTVGGDSVLGVPLAELRAANQRFFQEWMEG